MDDYRATARALIVAASFLAIASCATRADGDLARIENIVVIYAENRSFDHLYGLFPGAEGLAQATAEQKMQVDQDGKPLPSLPATYDPVRKGALRDGPPRAAAGHGWGGPCRGAAGGMGRTAAMRGGVTAGGESSCRTRSTP